MVFVIAIVSECVIGIAWVPYAHGVYVPGIKSVVFARVYASNLNV